MNFLQTYGKEILALVVPLMAWILNTFFKTRARLLFAIPHAFTFLVQEPLRDENGNVISPTQTVNTQSYLVSNAGKETATNVELVFNWKPLCLNVWPSRHFTEHIEPDNRYVLLFDSLAPNEYLGCELLSINNELPNLLTVRSDQCIAKTIDMYPQPAVPVWKRKIAVGLLLSGLALVVYIAIVVLQFVILETPVGH